MKCNLKYLLFNKNGNSLIQVIVAAGIASIIALGVAQMMSNQNREVKAIGEKLLAKELELQMKNLFANSDYCNCAFNGKTFDMTQTPPVIVAADQFTRLKEGYSAPTPTCTVAGGDFIPTVGTAVPGSTMTVGSIGLGGLTQVSPGVYKADLSVSFNNSIRSMKPIKTNVQFSVNIAGGSGPTARPFMGCNSNGGSTVVVLNPDLTYDGMTGTAACASIGKSCAYITSLNTIWDDAGCPGATHCMRVCMTWYNQSLPGIPNAFFGDWTDPVPTPGGQSTNIHSCAARVGRYTTYLHGGVVRCGGYFSAICQ